MLPHLNLSNNCEFSEGAPPAAAGVTVITGAVVDMQGYEGCLILVKLGDVTATAVLALKVQGGALSNGSDAADLTGGALSTLAAAGATDYDSKFLVLDVVKPPKRYIRGVLTRTIANSVLENITYIRYGRVLNPTVQAALPNATAQKVVTF